MVKNEQTKERVKIFHDTETTGLGMNSRLVSSAFMYRKPLNNKFLIKEDFANEGVLMDVMASVTTGITYDDYKYAPPFEKTFNYKALNYFNKKDYIYVAYNAYFDLKMLEKQGIFWNEKNVIDMYRVAKYVFSNKYIEKFSPLLRMKRKNKVIEARIFKKKLEKQTKTKFENYKLQYLRYLLEFDKQEDFKELLKELRITQLQAHEAKTDIIIMYYLYEYVKKNLKILENKEYIPLTDEKMIEISVTPNLESEINFGNEIPKGSKYKDVIGKTYTQVKTGKERSVADYLDWYVKNTDPMLDTYHTIKYYISKAVVDGDIGYKKDYKGHMNYSIVFAFNDEMKRKAIQKVLEENNKSLSSDEQVEINDDSIKDYEEYLKKSFKTIFERKIKELEEMNLSNNEYDNLRFLLRNLKVR